MAAAIIQQLVDDVNELKGVVPSAVALINGIGAKIAAAVQEALANGATAAELEPLTALSTEIDAQTAALAAAVAANP